MLSNPQLTPELRRLHHLITFSLVERKDAKRPGWALLATTTESPDTPDGLTICMTVKDKKSAAMIDLLKATRISGCSVFVQDASQAERNSLDSLTSITVVDEMPSGVSDFLRLAGGSK